MLTSCMQAKLHGSPGRAPDTVEKKIDIRVAALTFVGSVCGMAIFTLVETTSFPEAIVRKSELSCLNWLLL
ncbi:hypothetical protein KR51_00008330 [Rubidibacter lacunae KORDI 51-2]|uniref:Uncharacterized protein n=1 Tax=Rubidibacter lacunae KORDI 51-2 TaxID=582515 RepID=U5DS55_9CHRO|nr:hypothetical protein KR51_00008330 [Rubidibacter lacunae KORDI 51-2]